MTDQPDKPAPTDDIIKLLEQLHDAGNDPEEAPRKKKPIIILMTGLTSLAMLEHHLHRLADHPVVLIAPADAERPDLSALIAEYQRQYSYEDRLQQAVKDMAEMVMVEPAFRLECPSIKPAFSKAKMLKEKHAMKPVKPFTQKHHNRGRIITRR